MRVFRITAARFAADPLSGMGAAGAGARWNSKGTRVAYTASSRALAMMELLVHVGRDNVPASSMLLSIDIPDGQIAVPDRLPAQWDGLPYRASVQKTGDRWVAKGSSLALRVPSAVVPGEFNVLVNPLHADFGSIAITGQEPLEWDTRLFGKT